MRRPDRRPRREARAPCGISSRSAKGCRHEVIWTPLDTRRDREADLPANWRRDAISSISASRDLGGAHHAIAIKDWTRDDNPNSNFGRSRRIIGIGNATVPLRLATVSPSYGWR